MATEDKHTECKNNCWRIGAIVGVVSWLLLWAITGFGFIGALFAGAVIGVLTGLVLIFMRCRPYAAASTAAAETTTTSSAAAVGASAATTGVVAPTATAEQSAKPAAAVSSSVASKPVSTPVEDTPAEPVVRKAEVSEPNAAKTPAPAVKPAAAPKAAKPKKAAVKKVAAPVKTAPAPAKPSAPAAADATPALMLDAARPEGKDDLKLISGVGPKMELTLNEMGVFHFDQVAKFKKKDIEWVDARLRFKGRIVRDDWMSQAKVLAKGGETDFSSKKKKT